MKKYNVRQTLTGCVLLLAIAACAVPAQTNPTPFQNPSNVETSLASTARALAQRTETAQGFTPTPSPVPSDTVTPTPQISLYGTSLTVRDDQSSLFVDHKAGIQLVIPAGWMAFRVNEPEYYAAFTSDVVLANPALNDRLIQIQQADLKKYRLDAFDVREGHIPNGIICDINVVFQEGDTRTLEQWAKLIGNKKSIHANYKLLSMGYPKTADGTRVLAIEESWSSAVSDRIFRRAVYFTLPSGAVMLDFYSNETFKDTVLPDFEQVVNSLSLLNP